MKLRLYLVRKTSIDQQWK